MSNEMIVGLLSFLGTLIGAGGGVLTTAKLTAYRIQELEKKVDKHNTLVERMYGVERDVKVICTQVNDIKEHLDY